MKKILLDIGYSLAIRFAIFEPIFRRLCLRLDGGEYHSLYLRRYFKTRYSIDAGLYTYGCFNRSVNFGAKSVTLGSYCSIANDVVFFGANHPIDHFSMSPLFYGKLDRHYFSVSDDVWIGHGAKITCGCNSIGRGAVIGAGSVVTKNVPPYAVVVGSPAKVIKYRFSIEIIKRLEISKWWLLPLTELKCVSENTPPSILKNFVMLSINLNKWK